MFSGPHDPCAPNWNGGGFAGKIEVNDVTLAVRAGGTRPSLSVSGRRRKQGLAEYLRVRLTEPTDAKTLALCRPRG
jgi:hypothetical protein